MFSVFSAPASVQEMKDNTKKEKRKGNILG